MTRRTSAAVAEALAPRTRKRSPAPARSESKYRGLFEAAPDPMVVINQSGEIVLMNLQAETQFGYLRDELLGQQVTTIIPTGFSGRSIAERLSTSEKLPARQIVAGAEIFGRLKDGSEFPIEITLSCFESSDGLLLTAAIRNITVRKNIDRMKDEFVSTVSHELRTPLTSISGSLGLLTGLWAGKLPESAARLLTIAHANSQRLARLLNDILDIEKLEFGHVVFNLERVSVRALVEQVIEANRGYAEGYNIRVRLDVDSANGQVNADPDRLAQVITNLLSNAVKFSPTDKEVLVKVEANDDAVQISVRDHGDGIPASFRPHIFKKFEQADATNTRQKAGTGLGLSIAKQIVDRLGGLMRFEDAPGGGTIFHIELPTYAVDRGIAAMHGAAPIELSNDDDEATELLMAIRPPIPLARKTPRILHLDDDHAMLNAVTETLRTTAIVISVDSIESARKALAANRIDLAVLDIALVSGSGLDLLPSLHSADGNAIPIIILASNLAGIELNHQIQTMLPKSRESLESLAAIINSRLANDPSDSTRQIT